MEFKRINFFKGFFTQAQDWNDAEAYTGMFTLAQPTIRNLFDTRQHQDSFLKWAEIEMDYHDYLKKYWEHTLFAQQDKYLTFTDFWNHSLQDGVFEMEQEVKACPLYDFEFLGENQANYGSSPIPSFLEFYH